MPRVLSLLPSCWPQKSASFIPCQSYHYPLRFGSSYSSRWGSRVKCSFLNAPSPSTDSSTASLKTGEQTPSSKNTNAKGHCRLLPQWMKPWGSWAKLVRLGLLGVQGVETDLLRQCWFCWSRKSPLQADTLVFQKCWQFKWVGSGGCDPDPQNSYQLLLMYRGAGPVILRGRSLPRLQHSTRTSISCGISS